MFACSGPRMQTVAAALLTLLALTACGEDATQRDARLDAGTAAVLAEAADRVAARIDAGDDCGAMEEAELLFSRTREGVADGTVSPEVAREIEDVTAAVTAHLRCDEPSPEPTQVQERDRGDGGGGNGGPGKGNGRGKEGKGN